MNKKRTKMGLATKVRQMRQLKGYSQEYMAEHLGMCHASYSKRETEDVGFEVGELEQIAEIFICTVVDIITFDSEKAMHPGNDRPDEGRGGTGK